MQCQITPSRPSRTSRALQALCLAALLGSRAAAGADTITSTNTEDAIASMFSFSGFGTLGVVHSSEDHADFYANVFQASGAGYSRAWSPDVDSRIGAQVTAMLSTQFSAVVQVVSEQNYDGTYWPRVQWANIKYQFTPDLSVRLGRSILPGFLFSDTRLVGYTYPWVRPPVELYWLNPVTTNDGIDVLYRLQFNDLVDTLQANLGYSNTQLPNNLGTSRGRNSWGLTNTTEYGPFTLLLSFQASHLSNPASNPLFDAFRQFGPQGIAIANQYDDVDKPVEIEEVGASYDSGHWLIMSEWSHANPHSFLGDQTAWYASSGYRVGQFMPYLTYADLSAVGNSTPGLNLMGLPPRAAGLGAGLNAALSSILEGIAVQKTVSAGTRWDFAKNFDLKLQVDHTRLGAGSSGTLTNVQPGFVPGTTVNLFTATIDFVW
jgi:hypothetical protein